MKSENVYNLTSSSDLITVRQDQPYHHQLPPYGNQGSPFVIAKHRLLYPTSRFRINWSFLERKRLSEQLNKCFPAIYVLSHAFCMVFHSIIMIALQIAMLVTNGALNYVASGIWGGVIFIIIACVTILLFIKRSYWTLIASYILHVFGLFVAIGAYMVVNIIGIGLYRENCTIEPSLPCPNVDVKAISYIMFWMGVVMVIMVLIYLIFMPIYIMDVCNQRRKYKEEKKKATVNQHDDFLNHSYLYAQNNLNKDGTIKVQDILSVKTNLYEYNVEPVNRY